MLGLSGIKIFGKVLSIAGKVIIKNIGDVLWTIGDYRV